MRRWPALRCAAALLLAAAAGTAAAQGIPRWKIAGAPVVTTAMRGYEKLRGTIESIHPLSRRFTVRTLGGKRVHLEAGGSVVLRNFRVGDAVTVNLRRGIAVNVAIDHGRQRTPRPKTMFGGP